MSLLEIVITLAVGMIVVAGGMMLFNASNKAVVHNVKDAQVNQDIAVCARHIQRVGRSALGCQKKIESGVGVMECDIDRSQPPSGTAITVRFRPDGSSLIFEEKRGTPPAWVELSRCVSLQTVEFCNSAEMTAGTCTIPGTAIQGMLPSISNRARLFRFRMTGSSNAENASMQRAVQGAFYVRNPSPFSGFAYQW